MWEKDQYFEGKMDLVTKLESYRHIVKICKDSFEKLLILSTEEIQTINGPEEILSSMREEVIRVTDIFNHHFDKNGKLCSNGSCIGCDRCDESKNKKMEINCNFCASIFPTDNMFLLHLKKCHQDKISK